jgi:uncharacterized protein YwlG (UPF0340 family)
MRTMPHSMLGRLIDDQLTALGVSSCDTAGARPGGRLTAVDIAAVVVIVLLVALAAGLVVLIRGRSRVMDYHSHLDDSFELESAHKMNHGGGGGF